MGLTNEEQGWLAIIRANKLERRQEISKRFYLGRLEVWFNWRSPKNFWGRFGGGWNWCLGFEIGSTTLGLNLLVFRLSFTWRKRGGIIQ